MHETCYLFRCPKYALKVGDLPACRCRREYIPCNDKAQRNAWAAELFQRVKARKYNPGSSPEMMTRTCPSCGRSWTGIGKELFGRYRAGIDVHMRVCLDITPRERNARNRKDILRWKKKPPKIFEVVIDYDHPGLVDDMPPPPPKPKKVKKARVKKPVREWPDQLCECGCGQFTKRSTRTNYRLGHIIGKPRRYIIGHNGHETKPVREWPDQKCACGCGEITKRAPRTSSRSGYVKGQPMTWVSGHHTRGKGD